MLLLQKTYTMPLACPSIVRCFVVALFLMPQSSLSQSSKLHVAIGNNGYNREFYEYKQKANSLLIVNALTWSVQYIWKNDNNHKTRELLFEHFPIGTYLIYVTYPQPEYNYWKKFTVNPIPESFLGLHRQDTSTLPIDLTKELKNNNDSLKITLSSISCDSHNLQYIVLRKTAAGILCRNYTYQVEHGPAAARFIFICREPVSSSQYVLLKKEMMDQLNRAFNLSLVAFPGTDGFYKYYDYQLGNRLYSTGERENDGPLELYFAGIFR